MSRRAITYGECVRSGLRVRLERMRKDGHRPGMLVASDWYEPRHPLDTPPPSRTERHERPAPELSKPADEGTEAPALAFDELGKLI